MSYKFENLKFEINNPEHSEAIQKCLFELGYRWQHLGSNQLKCTSCPYLYCYEDGDVTQDDSEEWFIKHSNKKSYLLDLQRKLEQLNNPTTAEESNMNQEQQYYSIQQLLSTLQSDLAKANCYISLQHDCIWVYCNDTDKEVKCANGDELKNVLAAKIKFLESFKGE